MLIVVNVVAFRYGGRAIDLTRERTYSLSSLTLNQVDSLKRPVTFHMVYGRGPRRPASSTGSSSSWSSTAPPNPAHDQDREPRPVHRAGTRPRTWPSGSPTWRSCRAEAS